MRCCCGLCTPHQSPAVTASPQGEAFVAIYRDACYNTKKETDCHAGVRTGSQWREKSEGILCIRCYLFAMAGFPRILKSPCASKENRFPKLNLPTVYQRNLRAKLAVNTQTPVQVTWLLTACYKWRPPDLFSRGLLFLPALTLQCAFFVLKFSWWTSRFYQGFYQSSAQKHEKKREDLRRYENRP